MQSDERRRRAPGAACAMGAAARPWLVVCAAMVCCGWSGNQFTPLLVLYRRAYGWSDTTVDVLLGAYAVGLAPALLAGGPLADAFGRRRLAIAGVVASMVASLALAFHTLPAIAVGRLCSGVGVGLALAVGTTWMTELSVRGGGTRATAARRASLAITLGLGLGAGVAGVVAYWGPWPTTLPYLVQVALALPVLAAVILRGEETLVGPAPLDPRLGSSPGSHRGGARRPPARTTGHRRFRRLVVPMAPWVWATATTAYAILPQALGHRLGHRDLLYATLLTVCTLGTGVLVQPLARRLDDASTPRALAVSTVLAAAGIGLAAGAVATGAPWFGIVAAVALGAAYGTAIVSGLLETQRLAHHEELGRMTGIYYSLTYVGFLLPAAVAAAGHWASTAVLLGIVAALALACTVAVASGWHLPEHRH